MIKSRGRPAATPTVEQRPDRTPSISDEGWWPSRRPGGSPWEGEGHRKVWARHRVCRGILPQAGAPGMLREQPALAPSPAAAVAEIPMSRSVTMPPTHVDGRRSGVHGGRRLGLGIHRHRALERRVRRLACVQAMATASAALQPISMGLARLYASTSAGAARGLALRMDHGSQYLYRSTENGPVLRRPLDLFCSMAVDNKTAVQCDMVNGSYRYSEASTRKVCHTGP